MDPDHLSFRGKTICRQVACFRKVLDIARSQVACTLRHSSKSSLPRISSPPDMCIDLTSPTGRSVSHPSSRARSRCIPINVSSTASSNIATNEHMLPTSDAAAASAGVDSFLFSTERYFSKSEKVLPALSLISEGIHGPCVGLLCFIVYTNGFADDAHKRIFRLHCRVYFRQLAVTL
jgi:hypothetical protein